METQIVLTQDALKQAGGRTNLFGFVGYCLLIVVKQIRNGNEWQAQYNGLTTELRDIEKRVNSYPSAGLFFSHRWRKTMEK
jgi:hypothetical protein